jgi:hypothetical protein
MKQTGLRPVGACFRMRIFYTGRCPVLLITLFQSYLWPSCNLPTTTGQRPTDRMRPIYQALKGRNQIERPDYALKGLVVERHNRHRALPCAIDAGLSALKLTTLGSSLAASTGAVQGWSLASTATQSGDCAEHSHNLTILGRAQYIHLRGRL